MLRKRDSVAHGRKNVRPDTGVGWGVPEIPSPSSNSATNPQSDLEQPTLMSVNSFANKTFLRYKKSKIAGTKPKPHPS